MADRFICGAAVYLPLLRLERSAAANALAWSGLPAPRTGLRSVAGWDEDALTLAVEAARGVVRPEIRRVTFASTSAPFSERSQSGLMIAALGLDSGLLAQDVAGSRRCGLAALARALEDSGPVELIAAGERRITQAGSALQLAWGDGGASVLVANKGIARLTGRGTVNVDLADLYSSPHRPAAYQSEERFIRDEAVGAAIAPAVLEACRRAGIAPGGITIAAVTEPVAGAYRLLADAIGLRVPNVAAQLQEQAGDLGAAHPLFALALALERAKKGDRILLAGFGSGCDALVLDVSAASSNGATEMLAEGRRTADYVRFLNLAGSLELDWGPRGEIEPKTSASVLGRHGRDVYGFVGGRDRRGNVQFPKTLIPVSPEATGPEALEDVRLADVPANVVSITADRLNFTPDPPFHFGLVQFENGARVSMEFCDIGGKAPEVGDPVRMRFRIKSLDRRRGFRTYFWKAAPVSRPRIGEQ
jgi:hydroxymethylglutaryl-CoA synthase